MNNETIKEDCIDGYCTTYSCKCVHDGPCSTCPLIEQSEEALLKAFISK